MERQFKMVAKTLFGLEDVLLEELKKLGAAKAKKGIRNVSFYGDKGFMYKANLSLRTAVKVLVPIRQFKVFTEDDLYNQLLLLKWDDYINVNQTISVSATVSGENFTNSHYIALKSKDAIVDYFKNKYGKRPNVDLNSAHLQLDVHIQNNTCTISLNSSGSSLHKRGYRSATNIAPVNEVLAAGLVLLTGYSGHGHFIDPMCGSGTILIEAAMIAANIPANINRREFAFEKWLDFDEDLFQLIRQAQLNKIREIHYQIIGYDKAPSAVRKALDNIKNAGLQDFIKVEKLNFFNSEKPFKEPCTLLFNPPYGNRLEIDVPVFYKEIGNTLKQSYPNTEAWLITSDFVNGLKNVGLRTSKKIKLFNGKLECRLVKYEMYEGSKKRKSKIINKKKYNQQF